MTSLQPLGVDHSIVTKSIKVGKPRILGVSATFIETPRRFVVGPAARLDDQESCFPFVEATLDFVEETRTAAFSLMLGMNGDPVEVVRAGRSRGRTVARV